MAESDIALRHVLRFESTSLGALIEVAALRRADVVLRGTRYAGLVVDERVLTRAFPWVEHAETLQVIALVGGAMRVGATAEAPAIVLEPGDALLLAPKQTGRIRFEDVTFVDLEWDPRKEPLGARADEPRLLTRLDASRLERLRARLAAGHGTSAELYGEAIDLFRGAGAPLSSVSVDALSGGPTERDLRVSRAISAQLADLAHAATTKSLSEITGLSSRQLQRVLADFSARYRLNATNWRDMRNRYRLQIAMCLLGRSDASVAAIAAEVGYASPAALARALSNAGQPSPTELRDELARMASV